MKRVALMAGAAIVVGLVLLALLLGVWTVLFLLLLLLFAIYQKQEELLASLVCWAIGRIPQAYRWTMRSIRVCPNFAERSDPDAWSEIVVSNWTWHNPLGFDDGGVVTGPNFLLQIDELKFRMKLSSIKEAFTKHKSLDIDLLRIEGLRFNTSRNPRGALNLWQALALPDDDVNVKSIRSQANRYGGLHCEESEFGSAPEVVPLPPVSTAATRAAADYWRPEWGEKPIGSTSSDLESPLERHTTRSTRSHTKKPESQQPLLGEKAYVEEPIGDPRRRPRWGVPLRFDIRQLVLINVQLWVLDLITMDAHATSQRMHPDKKRIDVHTLNISRSRLEAGDARRSGSVDDVHGVYLGELVWVVVAEVIPLVLKRAATGRTAVLAAGFAMKDAAKRVGAKTVQAMHGAGHAIKEAVVHHRHRHRGNSEEDGCRLQVHLIGGQEVTRKGYAVNSHAWLELLTPAGDTISSARSEPQMWTKVPHWDENFELGPVGSVSEVLRVTLYHQKSRQVIGITHQPKETPERFIGEIVLPVSKFLIRDKVIAEGGEIVGWFPLTDPRGLRQGTPCSGQIKLGLRLTGMDKASLQEELTRINSSGTTCADFAILR